MSNNNNDRQTKDININAQAIEAGTTPERLKERRAQHSHPPSQRSEQQRSTTSSQADRLQDGYSLNEGSEYPVQPSNEEQQQDGYDPTHSGVRHAQNKPGMRTNNPGREGQAGWVEQMQMGKTSDTPHRKNPAD